MKRFLTIAIAVMAMTLAGATTVPNQPDRAGGLLAGAEDVGCQDLNSFSITGGTITHVEVVTADPAGSLAISCQESVVLRGELQSRRAIAAQSPVVLWRDPRGSPEEAREVRRIVVTERAGDVDDADPRVAQQLRCCFVPSVQDQFRVARARVVETPLQRSTAGAEDLCYFS